MNEIEYNDRVSTFSLQRRKIETRLLILLVVFFGLEILVYKFSNFRYLFYGRFGFVVVLIVIISGYFIFLFKELKKVTEKLGLQCPNCSKSIVVGVDLNDEDNRGRCRSCGALVVKCDRN